MAKVCEISGKRPLKGNNVSHAKNKTRRRFMPNLQKRRIFVPSLGRVVTFKKLSTRIIRTIDKIGIEAAIAKYKLNIDD